MTDVPTPDRPPPDAPPGTPPPGTPPPTPPPPRRRHRFLAAGALVILGVAIIAGALPRLRQRQRVRSDTAEHAVPTVRVIHPERIAPTQELVLPGNVQPYTSAPIFARVSGYVRRWYVDIGARVKQGQLLAELDVPELVQQLQQARGTLASSRAQEQLSAVTAKRFTALRQTRAVSQQEVDTAVNTYQANQATVAANQALVRQLEAQLGFARVVAPFDGIVSVRNVDVGDLVNAGSSTSPGTALFQMVKADTLRVFVSVPEPYAHEMKPKLTAELATMARPGIRFTGTLVRTANAIDPATRTLNIEIHVPNPTLELFSGAFAEVHFRIPARAGVFTVPVETLIFRKEGLHVATVVGDRAVLKPITPGRDYGTIIEITHGLTGDELVIESPPDSIANGQRVRVASPPALQARPKR